MCPASSKPPPMSILPYDPIPGISTFDLFMIKFNSKPLSTQSR
jgi:hypothetical protein